MFCLVVALSQQSGFAEYCMLCVDGYLAVRRRFERVLSLVKLSRGFGRCYPGKMTSLLNSLSDLTVICCCGRIGVGQCGGRVASAFSSRVEREAVRRVCAAADHRCRRQLAHSCV
jgi:hypothetical protein